MRAQTYTRLIAGALLVLTCIVFGLSACASKSPADAANPVKNLEPGKSVKTTHHSGLVYVTGDALNVRQKPSIKSPIVMRLPYGTKIKVHRTGVVASDQNHPDYWYKVPASRGFVSGAFLSAKEPPRGKKKFYLKRGFQACICFSEGIYSVETLILYNGRVSYNREGMADYEEQEFHHSGTYTLKNGGLYLNVKKGSGAGYENAALGKPVIRKLDAKAFQLQLFWSPQLKGFVTPEQQILFATGKLKANTGECFLGSAEIASHTGCGDYCQKFDKNQAYIPEQEFDGYYCGRAARGRGR